MEIAKLFMNGQSQAVRLPKAFRFDTEEVFIKKIRNAVVLLPDYHSWDSLVDSLEQFTSDFVIQDKSLDAEIPVSEAEEKPNILWD